MKSELISNKVNYNGFLSFFSDNIVVISAAIGFSFLVFGAYKFIKNINNIVSDDDLVYYCNNYNTLENLAFVGLDHLTSELFLNNHVFYSFCLNFFNNYSNIGFFLNKIDNVNKSELIDFINFCRTNPDFQTFKSFNVQKKVLLDFSRVLLNYVRGLRMVNPIFFS